MCGKERDTDVAQEVKKKRMFEENKRDKKVGMKP